MAKKAPKRKKTSHKLRMRLSFERLVVYLIAAFVFSLPLFIWPTVTEYGYGKTIFAIVGVSILLVFWGSRLWQRKSGKFVSRGSPTPRLG